MDMSNDDNLFLNIEKRHFDRNQLFYYLKVYNDRDQSDTPKGYLGDISTSGLMLFSKDSIEPGKSFRFRIDLEQEFGMEKNLVIDVTSLWCEKDANPDYYIIGFKYIDIDQASIDIVKYLTKKYGFEK